MTLFKNNIIKNENESNKQALIITHRKVLVFWNICKYLHFQVATYFKYLQNNIFSWKYVWVFIKHRTKEMHTEEENKFVNINYKWKKNEHFFKFIILVKFFKNVKTELVFKTKKISNNEINFVIPTRKLKNE